jgi:hypothetical protein
MQCLLQCVFAETLTHRLHRAHVVALAQFCYHDAPTIWSTRLWQGLPSQLYQANTANNNCSEHPHTKRHSISVEPLPGTGLLWFTVRTVQEDFLIQQLVVGAIKRNGGRDWQCCS